MLLPAAKHIIGRPEQDFVTKSPYLLDLLRRQKAAVERALPVSAPQDSVALQGLHEEGGRRGGPALCPPRGCNLLRAALALCPQGRLQQRGPFRPPRPADQVEELLKAVQFRLASVYLPGQGAAR